MRFTTAGLSPCSTLSSVFSQFLALRKLEGLVTSLPTHSQITRECTSDTIPQSHLILHGLPVRYSPGMLMQYDIQSTYFLDPAAFDTIVGLGAGYDGTVSMRVGSVPWPHY